MNSSGPTFSLVIPTNHSIPSDVSQIATQGSFNATSLTTSASTEHCVAIWDTFEGTEWFVGMTREKVGPEEFIVDHLEQVPNDSSKRKWQYPSKTDEQKTLRIQFLSCNLMGTWDLNKRKPVFVLHNSDVIDELFKGLYLLQ